MAKLTLNTVASGFLSVDQQNENFERIEAAFENTLSRDGTAPNSMAANLDMNGYKIVNVAPGTNSNDVATFGQLQAATFDYTIQRIQEFAPASPGQTAYTLTDFTYQPGQNNLAVYIDGAREFAFTEVDTTNITLDTPLAGGEIVVLVASESYGNIGDIPAHTHTTADIINLASYTGFDVRYYTEAEVDAAMALKASLAGAAFTGNISTTGNFSRKNANSATLTPQPRIFVQASDPGAAAADGDIWMW